MTLEDQIIAKAEALAADAGTTTEEALEALRTALIGDRVPIRRVYTIDGDVVDLNEETP